MSRSPDSQYRPEMHTVSAADLVTFSTGKAVYTAPYNAGRMLSAMPPSTKR